MFLSCFHQNCKELDLMKCCCQGTPTFFCKSHLQTHNQKYPNHAHKTKRESSICRKASTPEFTQKLISSINDWRNLKKSLIESLNTLSTLALNFISNIDKIIESLHKQIYNSSNHQHIFVQEDQEDYRKNYPEKEAPEKEAFEQKVSEIKASEKDLFYIDQKSWEFLQVPKFSEDLQSTFKSFISKLNMKFKDVHMDQSKLDLIFFENNSIILNVFDIDKKEVDKKIINLGRMQSSLGGLCYVNEHTVYFHEDCNIVSDPQSYFIDLRKFEATRIKDSIKNSYSSCVLFKKKVYVFGGYVDRRAISEAKYLDMDEEKYYSISSMPVNQYSTSTVNIGTRFVISGNNNKFMLIYDIVKDTYKNNSCRGFGDYHLLMSLGVRVFAVLNTWIIEFEYSDKDGGMLTEVRAEKYSSLGFDYVTGKPVIRGNMGYFNDCKGNVYRVDLEALTVMRVNEIYRKRID